MHTLALPVCPLADHGMGLMPTALSTDAKQVVVDSSSASPEGRVRVDCSGVNSLGNSLSDASCSDFASGAPLHLNSSSEAVIYVDLGCARLYSPHVQLAGLSLALAVSVFTFSSAPSSRWGSESNNLATALHFASRSSSECT